MSASTLFELFNKRCTCQDILNYPKMIGTCDTNGEHSPMLTSSDCMGGEPLCPKDSSDKFLIGHDEYPFTACDLKCNNIADVADKSGEESRDDEDEYGDDDGYDYDDDNDNADYELYDSIDEDDDNDNVDNNADYDYYDSNEDEDDDNDDDYDDGVVDDNADYDYYDSNEDDYDDAADKSEEKNRDGEGVTTKNVFVSPIYFLLITILMLLIGLAAFRYFRRCSAQEYRDIQPEFFPSEADMN